MNDRWEEEYEMTHPKMIEVGTQSVYLTYEDIKLINRALDMSRDAIVWEKGCNAGDIRDRYFQLEAYMAGKQREQERILKNGR